MAWDKNLINVYMFHAAAENNRNWNDRHYGRNFYQRAVYFTYYVSHLLGAYSWLRWVNALRPWPSLPPIFSLPLYSVVGFRDSGDHCPYSSLLLNPARQPCVSGIWQQEKGPVQWGGYSIPFVFSRSGHSLAVPLWKIVFFHLYHPALVIRFLFRQKWFLLAAQCI